MSIERNRVVCFLGDSITANGGWIGYISAFFAQYGRDKTLFFNCGVSGTTAACALERLYEDCLCFNPDTVFISFGINDIGWNLYDREYREKCDLLTEKNDAIAEYERNMDRLVTACKDYGAEPVLLTPSAYDDISENIDLPALDCNNGLVRCVEILEKISEKHGIKLIDVFSGFRAGLAHGITGDRTHPNDRGNRLIAALLLDRMGYGITEQELLSIRVTDAEKNRRAVEEKLRSLAYVKWYMGRSAENATEIAENTEKLNSEAEAEGAPAFMRKIADNYASAMCSERRLVGKLVYYTSKTYDEGRKTV